MAGSPRGWQIWRDSLAAPKHRLALSALNLLEALDAARIVTESRRTWTTADRWRQRRPVRTRWRQTDVGCRHRALCLDCLTVASTSPLAGAFRDGAGRGLLALEPLGANR